MKTLRDAKVRLSLHKGKHTLGRAVPVKPMARIRLAALTVVTPWPSTHDYDYDYRFNIICYDRIMLIDNLGRMVKWEYGYDDRIK